MVLYFWRENDFFTTLLLFIHFVSASIWKWYDIFMYSNYGIDESDVSRENLCCIIWYLKRNNCIVKNIFIACLLLLGETITSWSPLITLCYSPFLRTFINLTRFHSVSIFNGFIMLVSVMLLHAFLNLHVWLIFIRVLVSNLLGRDLRMLRWLKFWILQEFLTCRDNSILSVFDVWPAGRYLQMFCIRQ